MDKVNKALDEARVATITFLVGTALIVYAYVTKDISFNQAFQALGLAGVGSGAVGIARSLGGKGVKK
jgi:hypothetical protein